MRLIIETVNDNNRPGKVKYQVLHDLVENELATHAEFESLEDAEKYIDTFKQLHPTDCIEVIKLGMPR